MATIYVSFLQSFRNLIQQAMVDNPVVSSFWLILSIKGFGIFQKYLGKVLFLRSWVQFSASAWPNAVEFSQIFAAFLWICMPLLASSLFTIFLHQPLKKENFFTEHHHHQCMFYFLSIGISGHGNSIHIIII